MKKQPFPRFLPFGIGLFPINGLDIGRHSQVVKRSVPVKTTQTKLHYFLFPVLTHLKSWGENQSLCFKSLTCTLRVMSNDAVLCPVSI